MTRLLRRIIYVVSVFAVTMTSVSHAAAYRRNAPLSIGDACAKLRKGLSCPRFKSRPIAFGNGKGFAILGAVLAKPVSADARSYAYEMQAERWTPELLKKTKRSNFGFIRLIASIMPLMSDDADHRERGMAVLGRQIDEANGAGLGVSVSLGFWSSDPLDQDKAMPDPLLRRKAIRGWTELAAKLANRHDQRVALEFSSEPHCYPEQGPNAWSAVQLEMWQAVRRVAPKLPLVLTACRARLDKVIVFNPTPYKNDPNIVWSVHYYDFFSSQESYNLHGVPFPAKPALVQNGALASMMPPKVESIKPWVTRDLRDYLVHDRGEETMRDKLALVADWARRNGISANHVSVNEWSNLLSNQPINQLSRSDNLRWISGLRKAAEEQGFNWAFWTMPSYSLNYDSKTRFFRADTLKALGLAHNVKHR